MDLKNALTVCLISFFSATLVLLIARALDLQAASRLEPQLAKIVEELQSLRKQGGFPAASGRATEGESLEDGLVVYYFHGNVRCPTCRAIESQSHETVESEFDSQLESGKVTWKVLNYEEPEGTDLGKKFEVQMPVIVLATMKDGQIANWTRLDKVWALVGDKPAFAQFIKDEVSQMLEASEPQPTPAMPQDVAEIPLPGGEPSGEPVADGMVVYYFHATERCPTCRTIESFSREAIDSEFAAELDNGEISWQTVDYEKPESAQVVQQFDIAGPALVLAKMKDGQVGASKSLEDIWTLVDDEVAFAEYVHREVRQMLKATDEAPATEPNGEAAEKPASSDDPPTPTDVSVPADIPVPTDIPVPQ
ncbi:MAG: hypothetical protein H8E44_30705 [Planctomycetes bacterium]|nr:hypothetical protein [Planctomycetota bacterium]MBL7039980.1 hypothetical protein [Pirellulaceae bacterium]